MLSLHASATKTIEHSHGLYGTSSLQTLIETLTTADADQETSVYFFKKSQLSQSLIVSSSLGNFEGTKVSQNKQAIEFATKLPPTK